MALPGLNLNLGSLAAGGLMYTGLTGDPKRDVATLGNAYNTAYQGSLNLNSELAQNIQGGFEAQMADAKAANAMIDQRYGALGTQIQDTIRGIEQSRLTDINDQYARDAANAQQGLANRGLGNTTIVDSSMRGFQSDRDRARTRLANEIADLSAGYQQSIGLAGLSDLRRGQMQENDIHGARQGWLNSINIPYPDASMFSALAMQAGFAPQVAQDRGQLNGILGGMGATAAGAGGAGGLTANAAPSQGFMSGTGRPAYSNGPEGAYAGGVQYGGGPVVGVPPGAPPMAAPPSTNVPNLVGAGGGNVPYINSGTSWSNGEWIGGGLTGMASNVTGGVFNALGNLGVDTSGTFMGPQYQEGYENYSGYEDAWYDDL